MRGLTNEEREVLLRCSKAYDPARGPGQWRDDRQRMVSDMLIGTGHLVSVRVSLTLIIRQTSATGLRALRIDDAYRRAL